MCDHKGADGFRAFFVQNRRKDRELKDISLLHGSSSRVMFGVNKMETGPEMFE